MGNLGPLLAVANNREPSGYAGGSPGWYITVAAACTTYTSTGGPPSAASTQDSLSTGATAFWVHIFSIYFGTIIC